MLPLKDQSGKVANPAHIMNRENEYFNISLSPFAPEKLVSRDGFGSPVPRQPVHLHTQAESGAYIDTGFLPSSAVTSDAIGPVPSSSSLAIGYRWRSLPRVRRHRASKPQDSSKRVLPWQVTMHQIMCFSFPRPLMVLSGYRMLKVPAQASMALRMLYVPGTYYEK